MSRGKYSPTLTGKLLNRDYSEFKFNAKGEIPPSTWDGEVYNQEICFADYDSEGFDAYGYSAYLADGSYVGCDGGVDRNGITESQYLDMTDDEFEVC